MDINALKRTTQMLSVGKGCTAAELAEKMNLTTRQVKYLIEVLRVSFNCPIGFDPHRKVYYYTEKGKCVFGWQKSKEDLVIEELSTYIRRALGMFVLLIPTF